MIFGANVIVNIPKDQEHRFGCSGRMLKPSRASVEALVQKMPRGMVITTQALRAALAQSHNAQVTCPFLTKRALMAIAEDAETKAPFWRIVAPSGEMIGFYPGGGTEQARLLKKEGVIIKAGPGKYRVMNLRYVEWTERNSDDRKHSVAETRLPRPRNSHPR
jgi:alkylated DNA nucleotide flippase Atl1